ncbi:MAG: DUF192 domain-containing protein [Rhizobiaceae bacterium]|nr:DUF192 domain-containing protein [Rhizobiaceae bacterium]
MRLVDKIGKFANKFRKDASGQFGFSTNIGILGLALLAAMSFWAIQNEGFAQSNPASNGKPVFLESETIVLKTKAGTFSFEVEIADEPEERRIGLMHRRKMDLKHGMLFQFDHSNIVNMWMQNTVLPLDMIFIRPDGTIARIAERTTPFSEDIITSGEPVSHVLELNAGVAALIGLKPEDKVLHRFFKNQ